MTGLRDQAAVDLGVILETDAHGPRWPVEITDPDGLTASIFGLSNDISQLIDPNTGETVTGRLATIAVKLSSLTAAGFSALPRAIASQSEKPWRVSFNDITGNAYKFKVREANPDRALGLIVCILEAYEA